MCADRLILSEGSNDSSGDLQVSIPRKEIGSFLANLLGQPRTIKKKWTKIFSIDLQFLLHIDRIVEQRIKSQQSAHLVSFGATVYFSDNREESIESKEALYSFADNSHAETISTDLVWTYLVQFPGRAVPEKQNIALTISTGKTPERDSHDDNSRPRAFLRRLFGFDSSDINLTLEHTELTWGLDLLNHLEREIRKMFVEESEWIRRLRKTSSFLIPLFSMMYTVSIIFPLMTFFNGRSSDLSTIKDFGTINSPEKTYQETVSKLDYLVNRSQFKRVVITKDIIATYISIAAVLLSGWIFLLLAPESFLCLNKFSADRKATIMNDRVKIKSSASFVFVLGVLASILGGKILEVLDKILQ